MPFTNAGNARVDGVSYTIDVADIIVAVSGKWDDFARNNKGEEILSSKIIGKKLDQFIHGDETLMFVRTMIMSVRIKKKAIHRAYRCDSPDLKRYMEMTLLPHGKGVVEVIHRELRNEPVVHKVRVVAASRSIGQAPIKRCSVCNRVRIQDDWSEIDEAVEARRLPSGDVLALKVVYGVCPDCLQSRDLNR